VSQLFLDCAFTETESSEMVRICRKCASPKISGPDLIGLIGQRRSMDFLLAAGGLGVAGAMGLRAGERWPSAGASSIASKNVPDRLRHRYTGRGELTVFSAVSVF
jgi:hypothetical protein